MTTIQEVKTERIDIRTTLYAKRLLQEAARVAHKNVSDFLLESGIAAAEQSLADRRVFALDDTAWHAFQAVLDRPVAKAKPHLRKLLTHKGVLG